MLYKFEYYADDDQRGAINVPNGGWEQRSKYVGPGPHTFTFAYEFNPLKYPPGSLPSEDNPAFENRTGVVYIDDVYFVPDTPRPTPSPVPETPRPTQVPTQAPVPTVDTFRPTLSPVTPTSRPTKVPTQAPVPDVTPSPTPDGAAYYESFEVGSFPYFGYPGQEGDPEWRTTTDNENESLVWERTDEESDTGRYSLKSPNLDNDLKTSSWSDLILTLPDYGSSGRFFFSVWAGNQMPSDNFLFFIDDEFRARIENPTDGFRFYGNIPVGPGSHTFAFVYEFNPTNIPPDFFPESPADRTGVIYIDEVYFIPDSPITPRPTQPPTKAPTSSPTRDPTSSQPSPEPISVPTGKPTSQPTSSPTPQTPGPLPYAYYQGFETGDFPLFGGKEEVDPVWGTTNDDDAELVWKRTDDQAFVGNWSLKTPNLETDMYTPAMSNLTLVTPDDFGAGTLYFSVWAGCHMPYDRLNYTADNDTRGVISLPTGGWEQRSKLVGPGSHVFTFIYEFNPLDLPPQVFEGLEDAPVYENRTGVVYIDDVYFVPTNQPDSPKTSSPTGKPTPPSPVMTSSPVAVTTQSSSVSFR